MTKIPKLSNRENKLFFFSVNDSLITGWPHSRSLISNEKELKVAKKLNTYPKAVKTLTDNRRNSRFHKLGLVCMSWFMTQNHKQQKDSKASCAFSKCMYFLIFHEESENVAYRNMQTISLKRLGCKLMKECNSQKWHIIQFKR